MAIKIDQYQSQTQTPSATVSNGSYRAPNLGRTAEAVTEVSAQLSQLAQRSAARRDEMDLLDYERNLGQIDTDLLIGNDETPGALYQTGRNAEEIAPRTMKAWDERTTPLMPKLRTEEGRARARQMLQTRRQDSEVRVTKHQFDQGLIADKETTGAALTAYKNEAVANADDPSMVDASIARAAGARAGYGRRIGESDEATAVAIAAQQSDMLRDVIAVQVARNPMSALETFKRNADRLIGDDRIRTEVALQPFILDTNSRAIGDSLYDGQEPSVGVGASSVYNAIALVESGGKHFDDAGQVIRGPMTATGERAVGKFQIMPATGPEAAKLAGEKWDPKRFEQDEDYNARLGRAYIDNQIKSFGGNMAAVAAAYNMGPAAARGWMAGAPYQTASGKTWSPKGPMDYSAMPTETRNYVRKVLDKMGGQPEGTLSAIPDTSLGVAEREVAATKRADTIADPREREAAINRIQFRAAQDRKLIQERERAAQVNKAEMTAAYNNVVAKLADGVDVPVIERPTLAQLSLTYGAGEGGRKYGEMQTYAAVAPAVSQLKTATLEEAPAIMNRFRPNPKSDNYAFEARLFEGLQASWLNVQKQRNADPAAFLLTNSPAVAQQYAGVAQALETYQSTEDPTQQQQAAANLAQKGQAYTEFMMAEQERLGVPFSQRKLLPVTAAKKVMEDFDGMVQQGKVAEATNLVRATVAAYGDGAAVAIQQLGEGAGPVARFALEGIDTRTIESYVAAKKEGDKVLKDSMGNDAWNATQDRVRQQLAALDATGTSEYGAYFDGAMAVAAAKVKMGLSPEDAADQATSELINSRYVFGGQNGQITYRVPRGTPQGQPIDAQAVVRSADMTLNSLKPEQISTTAAIPAGVQADEFKRYHLSRIQRTGQWRTLGDESGLQLLYQDDSGRLVPVRKADGSLYKQTWADLTARKTTPVDDAAYRATIRGTR